MARIVANLFIKHRLVNTCGCFIPLKVLHLEQMLTTGGGWQDQCGGLYGGLKMSWSEKELPVHVQTRPLSTKFCFQNPVMLIIYHRTP